MNPETRARGKLHRAVDAQVATANSIPWSSTAKFSRNGVLVAPFRVSYALTGNYARATSSLTIRLSSALPHRIAPHFDPVCIVDQPVKNAIGECRIADLFMPARDRQLRSEDRRAHLVAVLADLPKIAALRF